MPMDINNDDILWDDFRIELLSLIENAYPRKRDGKIECCFDIGVMGGNGRHSSHIFNSGFQGTAPSDKYQLYQTKYKTLLMLTRKGRKNLLSMYNLRILRFITEYYVSTTKCCSLTLTIYRVVTVYRVYCGVT